MSYQVILQFRRGLRNNESKNFEAKNRTDTHHISSPQELRQYVDLQNQPDDEGSCWHESQHLEPRSLKLLWVDRLLYIYFAAKSRVPSADLEPAFLCHETTNTATSRPRYLGCQTSSTSYIQLLAHLLPPIVM